MTTQSPKSTAAMSVLTVSALGAAVTLGALAGVDSRSALMAVLVIVVVLVAAFSPVGTVALLLAATVLLPFDLQNAHAVASGPGKPGLLLVDVLLLVALLRVFVRDYRDRALRGPALVAYGLLAFVALQLLHGALAGWSLSEAGAEARRVVMAIGGFLVALPVLRDPVQRRMVPVVLGVVAVALGAAGLVQWMTAAEFNGSDFGVRQGTFGTTSGSGQLQYGLFAYPIAVVLSFAALISGRLHAWSARALVLSALSLNVMCLIFTYERTFWLAAVLGCLLVVLLATPAARRRAWVWVPVGVVVLVVGMVLAAPDQLRTALERGASVSEVESDSSGEYRVVESRLVSEEIRARLLDGSGFGATFSWQPPGATQPTPTPFVHSGYLWLTWKTGVVFTVLCVALILATIIRRPGWARTSLNGALTAGARAALLGLLVINITFAGFNALGIAVVTGLLFALCWAPGRFNGEVASGTESRPSSEETHARSTRAEALTSR